jgi:hypothetical protein
MTAMKKNLFNRYSFLWVTLILFLGSLGAHWTFAWKAYVNEQEEKNLPVEVKDYLVEVSRDTFENWQSEFLQLIWQVAGLSFLFYVGSPQSREGDDRKEEKIDYLIKKLDKENGEREIARLEKKYPKD